MLKITEDLLAYIMSIDPSPKGMVDGIAKLQEIQSAREDLIDQRTKTRARYDNGIAAIEKEEVKLHKKCPHPHCCVSKPKNICSLCGKVIDDDPGGYDG